MENHHIVSKPYLSNDLISAGDIENDAEEKQSDYHPTEGERDAVMKPLEKEHEKLLELGVS